MISRTLAAVFALEAVMLGAVGTLALDVRAHYHVEDLGGVNIWGYRGPVSGATVRFRAGHGLGRLSANAASCATLHGQAALLQRSGSP